LRVLIIVTALFLIWSTARLEPWSRTTEHVDASESQIPWTEVNPIGVNTFLAREVEPWKREQTLDMASAAGVGWIKEHFAWRAIETAPDSYWDSVFQQDAWAKYDAIVDSADRHNLRVVARIDLAPQWARPIGSEHTAPPTNYSDFADFIAEFVRHYDGRVQFIQIWNEPNLAAEWGGQIDPEGYAHLLQVAASAARAVDPNIVILSAPLAMTTENSDRAMDDLSYWQALYDAGAAGYFDIMSANAYGLDQPFDAAPDPNTLNIRRIELLREIAVRNGDGGKAIWLNEFGWNASPEDFDPEALIWSRVSEANQAQWTAKGIEYLRSEHEWFGVANIWYFRQVGDIPIDRSDYYFRAVDVEFTPRPLYVALRDLGNDIRFGSPGIYNDLSPAVRSGGDWKVIKDVDSINGEYISGMPGSTLTIQIDGNEAIALLAAGQRSTELLVVDENEAEHRVNIVDGLRAVQLQSWSVDQAPQKRSLRIEVVGSQPLLLDGLEVRERRSARTLLAGGAALLAVLAGIVLIRRGLPA
jgi:polysaccharide biosynthesis protein PslG